MRVHTATATKRFYSILPLTSSAQCLKARLARAPISCFVKVRAGGGQVCLELTLGLVIGSLCHLLGQPVIVTELWSAQKHCPQKMFNFL